MKYNILKKASNLMKDSALLLRPLSKNEKWNVSRFNDYLSQKEVNKIRNALKQKKISVSLNKLDFSFLISGKNVLPQVLSEKDSFEEINKKIESKFYEKLFYSFSSRSYDVLFHYLASDLMYSAEVKRAIILQLFSKYPLHILIIGETGSGKGALIKSVKLLSPKISHVVGSTTSKKELTFSVKKGKISLGLIPKADKGILCISEIDKINKKNMSFVLSSMEEGKITDKKTIKARVKVLATVEPTEGEFKEYDVSQIKKQIGVSNSILSKFHLVFVIKRPDEDKFEKIADNIITESIKKKISKDEISFINKYIKFVSNVKVKIPKNMSDQVKDFVVGLKKMEKKLPFLISSKTVEGIVTLVKASARSELRSEVETKDLERVFSIIRRSLQI